MNRIKKLGLGTVQWGIPYGITNCHGMTPPESVREILIEASRNGVSVLDTASLYGESEVVLGTYPLENFHVITKTPQFGTSVITEKHSEHLTQTFLQSLQRLSSRKIYGLLIHNAQDLLVPGGDKLITAMMSLKDNGTVEKIGVSIYDSEQADAVLKIFKPDIVQLPINVLDQRMLLNGRLERMKNMGIEIHARSVFLQGLLLMPLNRVPTYFDPIRPILTLWHAAAEAQGMSPVQAALSFVRDIPYIDSVLIGVENLEQFHSCCADFEDAAKFDATGLACHEPAFINPAHWKLS